MNEVPLKQQQMTIMTVSKNPVKKHDLMIMFLTITALQRNNRKIHQGIQFFSRDEPWTYFVAR